MAAQFAAFPRGRRVEGGEVGRAPFFAEDGRSRGWESKEAQARRWEENWEGQGRRPPGKEGMPHGPQDGITELPGSPVVAGAAGTPLLPPGTEHSGPS